MQSTIIQFVQKVQSDMDLQKIHGVTFPSIANHLIESVNIALSKLALTTNGYIKKPKVVR